MKKVLMIVGSLRKHSFNRQLAVQAEALLEGRAEVSYLSYADLPLLNQDLEFPVQDAVARVREAVREADGLWIVSPEYNFQIPGVLKNLLDWLSRPTAPGAGRQSAVTAGKVVTLSGAAGRSGAAGVRKNLSALMAVMNMKLVGGMGTGISMGAETFASGVLTLSPEQAQALKAQAEEFLEAL